MTVAKGIRQNEHFKNVVAVVLVVAVVFGLFFGLRAALNTPDPALTVVSGSMSIPYDANDNNFWLTISTPFDRTLSVGDIIIVQGVNPQRPEHKLPQQRHNSLPRTQRLQHTNNPPHHRRTKNQRSTLLRNKRRRQREPLGLRSRQQDTTSGIHRLGLEDKEYPQATWLARSSCVYHGSGG